MTQKLANLMVVIVALEHLAFLVLEMFLWTEPVGMRVFGLTPEFAAESAPLAMNQGLYNGFLAAGLIWGLVSRDNGFAIKLFFLVCVLIAGIFGGLTAKASIIVVQGAPALLALGLLLLANRQQNS